MTVPSHPAAALPDQPAVALVTLGCARNEVDSDELAARLAAGGFRLVAEPGEADAVLVNTCGFVASAKKDSVDTLLAAADLTGPRAVVAVGCLAERYGAELAEALPEADAVLGFDDYPEVADRVRAVLAGERLPAHTPADRRRLLPLTPVERPAAVAAAAAVVPGVSRLEPAGASGSASTWQGPRVLRRRLDRGPTAPLKLASGCDRRCAFCAIPSFRGSFVSRPPGEVLAEAAWLVADGVREVVLVSENSTSYGKDLGDVRLLEALLPELAAVDGLARVRVSYLQPAEMRPGLVDVLAATPGVAPYFDLSFQHASGPLLRRMRRFGDSDTFLALLEQVRARAPRAGVRSNVIVGFPGETEDDLVELEAFLAAARLDVVGVFGYSDEAGTEAATLPGQLPDDEIAARVARVSALVDELVAQRATERVGERLQVLVESVTPVRDGAGDRTGAVVEGRAEHQGPEVDGTTVWTVPPDGLVPAVGDLVEVAAVASDGADLVAALPAEVPA